MIETFCKRIADATSDSRALVGAILFQVLWIIVGSITRMDPFPFVFLLTISNVIQLILIFVLAVAQRQAHDTHAERHEDLKAHITQAVTGGKVSYYPAYTPCAKPEDKLGC